MKIKNILVLAFVFLLSGQVNCQSLDSMLRVGVQSTLDSTLKWPLKPNKEDIFYIKNLKVYTTGRIEFILIREVNVSLVKKYSFTYKYNLGDIEIYFVENSLDQELYWKFFSKSRLSRVSCRSRKKMLKKIAKNGLNALQIPWVAEVVYKTNSDKTSLKVRPRDKCD